MKSFKRSIVVAVILTLCAVVVWYVWLVLSFHGASDSDIIEIVQTQFASPHRVAMLVRRSDHAALSGDTYFVFIDDHLYPVPQLRKTLYSLHPVFKVGRDGVAIRWSSPSELTIECHACGITKEVIETQKFSDRGINIRYIGFP